MRLNAGWLSAGIAALLLTAGCQREGQSGQQQQGGPSQVVEQAQQRSEQAFEQARKAQEQASQEQKDAVSARQDVEEAQRKLQEAQAKVQQETQQAQQTQQQAQQQTQQAQQTASESQAQALEAQRQQQQEMAQQAQQQSQQAEQNAQAQQQQAQQPVAQAQPPADAAPQGQGARIVVGDVLTASENEVLVSSRGEPQVRLQVGPQTQVFLDGQKASPADIREGSQVRASYQDQGGEPTAVRIDVTSAQQPVAPGSQEAGESPRAVPPVGSPPVQQ